MRLFRQGLIAAFFLLISSACTANTEENTEEVNINTSQKVEVLYFHFSRRCATCNAVENTSKAAVSEINTENISFNSYNLQSEEGEAKSKSLGVSGQTLLIVSGEEQIKLTQEAFMYARSNPEKLKQIIKSNIAKIK